VAATPSRKLAVILHADVVGSTTLVHKDETLAHQRIQDAFQRLSKTTASYGGTALEIRGDALVAEFSRASDAVSAALAFQIANMALNATLNDDIRPQIRIGIALGEVVTADKTITGVGVVLAQRLEQLAESDGVVVQGSVSETVPIRLPFIFESLGEQSVKGFDQPVRAFTANLKPGETLPEPDSYVASRLQKEKPDDRSAQPTLELPDKPSIAVLPFTNMSGDPEHEYFSDGITEDIITELSRYRELFVIAGNSTFRFKGKDVEIGEIAHQLGVQYIVEGSVRRSGKRVRITAQLVDALSGSEVWADRYDRDLDDIFVVQDEVVAAIVGALPSRVRLAELERADRRPMDLRAYDLAQRAWQLLYQWTKTGIETATELAVRALEIDPKNGSAHAVLVGVQLLNWRRCWRGTPEETLRSALAHGRSAVEVDETEYTGHWYLSEVYLFRLKDLEQAKVHAERAVKLCPNASGPLSWMGLINGCSGDHQAGIESCNKALRLDPFAPDYLQYLAGCVHFNAGDYEEAVKKLHATQWLSKPELLSATYVHMGRRKEAREILASHIDSIAIEMMKLPDDWFTYFTERCPYVREKDIAHYLSGLEAALK
jgi:TolB-like protein/class 3 adenylate cyclase